MSNNKRKSTFNEHSDIEIDVPVQRRPRTQSSFFYKDEESEYKHYNEMVAGIVAHKQEQVKTRVTMDFLNATNEFNFVYVGLIKFFVNRLLPLLVQKSFTDTLQEDSLHEIKSLYKSYCNAALDYIQIATRIADLDERVKRATSGFDKQYTRVIAIHLWCKTHLRSNSEFRQEALSKFDEIAVFYGFIQKKYYAVRSVLDKETPDHE
jgi:hypothetical protein